MLFLNPHGFTIKGEITGGNNLTSELSFVASDNYTDNTNGFTFKNIQGVINMGPYSEITSLNKVTLAAKHIAVEGKITSNNINLIVAKDIENIDTMPTVPFDDYNYNYGIYLSSNSKLDSSNIDIIINYEGEGLKAKMLGDFLKTSGNINITTSGYVLKKGTNGQITYKSLDDNPIVNINHNSLDKSLEYYKKSIKLEDLELALGSTVRETIVQKATAQLELETVQDISESMLLQELFQVNNKFMMEVFGKDIYTFVNKMQQGSITSFLPLAGGKEFISQKYVEQSSDTFLSESDNETLKDKLNEQRDLEIAKLVYNNGEVLDDYSLGIDVYKDSSDAFKVLYKYNNSIPLLIATTANANIIEHDGAFVQNASYVNAQILYIPVEDRVLIARILLEDPTLSTDEISSPIAEEFLNEYNEEAIVDLTEIYDADALGLVRLLDEVDWYSINMTYPNRLDTFVSASNLTYNDVDSLRQNDYDYSKYMPLILDNIDLLKLYYFDKSRFYNIDLLELDNLKLIKTDI